MKLSLRLKFILLSAVLVTVIMATITYFYTIREIRARQDAAAEQMQNITRNIATMHLLDRQDWSTYQDYISRLTDFNSDIVYIAVLDNRNTLRAHTLNTQLVELDRPIVSRRLQAEVVRRLDEGAVASENLDDLRTERLNILVGDRVLGSVHLGYSIIEINRELHWRIKFNIGLGVLFILIAVTISVYFSRRLTRPLEDLSNAMISVSEEGNLDRKVQVDSRDEIGHLADTFNTMIDGLRERQVIENLGYELSATFQFDRLAPLVRDRLNSAIGAAGTRLYIRTRHDHQRFGEIGTFLKNGIEKNDVTVEDRVQRFLLEHKSGFMIHSAPDFVLKGVGHTRENRNGLVVPMAVKDELFGLLFFELPVNRTNYTRKEINFAATLANQAALALENSLLYEDLREKERIKRELEIAHEFQQKLLPERMPVIDGFEFDGVCLPAREVGGDYFDFFKLDHGRLGIVIADVSGHGASASFYMAQVRGMMLQLIHQHASPGELLSDLNQNLCESIERSAFVTMIYGILDPSACTFTFVRAGHHAMLHLSASGTPVFVKPAGLGLGLDRFGKFEQIIEEHTIHLCEDDTLFLYTDGLVEAVNGGMEEFGESRLADVLHDIRADSAAAMKDTVLGRVRAFMRDGQSLDDITLVVIRYTGCEPKLEKNLQAAGKRTRG